MTVLTKSLKRLLPSKCGENTTYTKQKTLIIKRLTGFKVLGAGIENFGTTPMVIGSQEYIIWSDPSKGILTIFNILESHKNAISLIKIVKKNNC